MTTPTLANIAAEIDRLNDNLRIVEAAIPVMGKPAEDKARTICTEIAAAQHAYATALADKAEQDRKERLAGFTDIRIRPSYPNNAEVNLLRASFTIDYTKLEYDNRYRDAYPVAHQVLGFSALPDDAYVYLVTERPDAIPAEIMALHPGNPHEAFRAYFQGMQRGMFRTASRVDRSSDLSLAA